MSVAKLNSHLKKMIFVCASLLVIITPFLFTWFNSELFEFNKMMFVYLMTVLITFAWVGRMVIVKKIIFKHTFLDWFWLAWLIAQVLSTIFSLHPRTSIFGYYSRFHGGLLSTLCYVLIYWALVSNLSFKKISTLIKMAVVAGIGVSLYAIPERLGFSPSCLLIQGKLGVGCWVQDVQHRVFATFGQPNWLGAYLGMLLPLAVSFYLNSITTINNSLRSLSASFLQKIILHRWLLAIVTIFLALVFTQSRSALLGLTFSMAIMLGYKLLASYRHHRSIGQQKHLLFAVLLLLGTALVAGTSFTPSLKTLISRISIPTENHAETEIPAKQEPSLPPNIIITPSEEIRMIVWRGAIKVWQRYPLLGSGPETFAYSYYRDRSLEHNLVSEWDFLYNKAHNELLNLLATTGAIGLGTYLALTIAIFYLAGKTLLVYVNKPKTVSLQQNNLVLGITAGLIGFHITNFIGFSTVMVSVLWVFFTAYLSLAAFHSTEKEKGQLKLLQKKIKQKKSAGFTQVIVLLWLFFIALHFLLRIVSIWQADHYFFKGKTHASANQYPQAIHHLQRAILLSPHEAVFYDELANVYAQTALELFINEEDELAQDYTQLAEAATYQATQLNPHHLNFLKTQSLVFKQLTAIDEQYFEPAMEALMRAKEKAPTDPKIVYQMGLIELSLGNQAEAISTILKAIDMKPNYHQARYRLGLIYEINDQCPEALEQYQFILDYLIPQDPNLQERINQLPCYIELPGNQLLENQ